MLADQVRDAIVRIPQPLIAPTRAAFVEYLRFCHGIMQSSETLLEMAAKACPRGMLKDYYLRSLQDEQGHAMWILEDLASMDEKLGPLDHACAWLAGAQYYYLHHIGPHPLLGYIAALEMNPPKLENVRKLEEMHGKRAMRTIRHHAEQDIEHAERLDEVLNEQNEYREAILYNAITSAQAFAYYCGERTSR